MIESLIDTDILSEFMRGNSNVSGKVEDYLSNYEVINISVITYYEVMNGLFYKDARKQLSKFEEFISLNRIIPLSTRIAKIAAEIQADLRKTGNQIGHTDTLIAATALANNLQLVTNNTEHFKRIANLSIENWTQ